MEAHRIGRQEAAHLGVVPTRAEVIDAEVRLLELAGISRLAGSGLVQAFPIGGLARSALSSLRRRCD